MHFTKCEVYHFLFTNECTEEIGQALVYHRNMKDIHTVSKAVFWPFTSSQCRESIHGPTSGFYCITVLILS
jgi:hypothetical protein